MFSTGLGVEFESEGVFEANPVKSKTIFKPLLDETDANYWIKDAQRYLKQVLNDPRETMKPKKAKNIIFFLGDGMSLTTVAATRMYLGDENKSLSFEKFAHFGLSKVCMSCVLWIIGYCTVYILCIMYSNSSVVICSTAFVIRIVFTCFYK